MSVLVFVEADNNEVKKSSLAAVQYGKEVAALLGGDVIALCTEAAGNLENLGGYGASKVLHADNELLSKKSIAATSAAISQAAEQVGAHTVVMSRSSLVDPVAPRVGVKLGSTVVSNIVSGLEKDGDAVVVSRSVFTNKAISKVKVSGEKRVLTITKNAVNLSEGDGSTASVEAFAADIPAEASRVTLKSVKKQEGDILLPEAERVVSAGRGLKGPENWGMVEELAQTLTAATACSKPVSDLDWRPHHEHVGQTGIKVSPELYIAVGISGAIQHLAGVSSSRKIVVINKDEEAPFFKSADYGIVGDAFEVLPKLNEAFKKALA